MVSQLQTVSRGTGIPAFNVGVGPFRLDGAAILDGASGGYISTPSTPLNTFTGDFDATVDAALEWQTGGSSILIAKSAAVGDQRGWRVRSNPNQLEFRYSTDGVNSFTVSATVPNDLPDGSRHLIRMTRVAATGVVSYYVDGVLIDAVTAGAGAMVDNTADIEVGSQNNGTSVQAIGDIFSAQVFDGINGTLAVNFDADGHGNLVAPDTFTDPLTGAVYTVHGTAIIVPGAIKHAGMLLDENGAVYAVENGVKVSFNGGIGFDIDGRMSLNTIAEDALEFPGNPGDNISTPSSVLNTLPGDIEFIIYAAKANWSGATTNQVFVGKWNPGTNDRGFRFGIEQTGLLRLQTSTNGTGVSTNDSTIPVPILDGVAGWLRCLYDNLANTITFFTSNDPASTPFLTVTWAQLGAPVAHVAGATFASVADAEIGSSSNGTSENFDGTISLVKVLDGIGGTVAISVDASDAITNPFTDPTTGAIWTLNGDVELLTGGVASLGPGATPFDIAGNLLVGGATDLIYMGVGLAVDGKVASS